MFLLDDPMFYVCMITSVTVIYMVALAGSGRDHGVQAPGAKITASSVHTPVWGKARSRDRA
jgi:hypothetical protein